MDIADIIAEFDANKAKPEDLAGMGRFGINVAHAYGVKIPVLRALARRLGRDHELAHKLWATGIHEGYLLASMIAEPAKLTRDEMDRWVADFDSWDVCDQCCTNLFRRSPLAHEAARAWAGDAREFVKRAGYSLIAVLAVHDKEAPDARFLAYLALIENGAEDGRNFVKKSVNWALRQIGKRNGALRLAAIEAAERIAAREPAAARWIARDALRELRDPKTISRLSE